MLGNLPRVVQPVSEGPGFRITCSFTPDLEILKWFKKLLRGNVACTYNGVLFSLKILGRKKEGI